MLTLASLLLASTVRRRDFSLSVPIRENPWPSTSRLCYDPSRTSRARALTFFASAIDNEAALPALPSQGGWMEAMRTHDFGVRRASR